MFTDRQFDAYQSFVLGCKLYWTGRMFPAVRSLYEEKAARSGRPVTGPEDVGALIGEETLYREFAWMERHLQRFKYSGRYGLVPTHDKHRAAFEAALDAPLPDGLLELDPDFEQPKYYRSVDIHQHPGGVWSDSLAGVVYERGARSTTPLLERDKDLHHRFTDIVRARRQPRRLLDMGCGFGKSSRPFYEGDRDAQVVGVDLAAPCLKLAAQDAARAQARNVRFLQRSATDTKLPDESFDVVTSTMMLHEMPPPVIREVIDESFRLLEPGGLAIHLDFLPPDDPFLTFIHYGHGRRNNEPFMEPLAKMEIADALRAAGFRNVETLPFDEAPGSIAAARERWRFPWTVIVAEK